MQGHKRMRDCSPRSEPLDLSMSKDEQSGPYTYSWSAKKTALSMKSVRTEYGKHSVSHCANTKTPLPVQKQSQKSQTRSSKLKDTSLKCQEGAF